LPPSERLSRAALPHLAGDVVRPDHDPAALRTGIVHLGVGAFHRAHLASYTDALLGRDARWGILGASLRHPDVRDALAPQDFLYALALRDGSAHPPRVIGAHTGILVAPEDPAALVARMAAPEVAIVSLTVTEKGYCRTASGDLDIAHPDIAADLAAARSGPAKTPRSVPGFLAAAFAARRKAGIPAFTVLSCDNLPHNGAALRRVVSQFATLTDPDLGAWIAEAAAFPSTMVDRIVPATTASDRAAIALALGAEDAWPVVAEPFTQWVLEACFPLGRPAWEEAGATLVADVRPWEEMKLRLLNGSHSAIAYLGQLAGWETVAEAVAEPALASMVADLMAEVAPTLSMPAGIDVAGYERAVLARFANPALKHRTAQIAADGSQKLPQRLLAPARVLLASGRVPKRIALALAAFIRFCQGRADDGGALALSDPEAEALRERASHAGTSVERVRAVLALPALGAADLVQDEGFVAAIAGALEALAEGGVRAALTQA
jgi:fructuronate reductase